MADTEKTLFLITEFGHFSPKDDKERLVSATTRAKAVQHVIGVNKASPADVARVLGAGGKVEEAVE